MIIGGQKTLFIIMYFWVFVRSKKVLKNGKLIEDGFGTSLPQITK